MGLGFGILEGVGKQKSLELGSLFCQREHELDSGILVDTGMIEIDWFKKKKKNRKNNKNYLGFMY